MAWKEIHMSKPIHSYPRRIRCAGTELELRVMSADDTEAVLAFAAALPPHDLIFLQRDIRNSKVVAAWIEQIARGTITSLLAVADGTIHGCATIVQDNLSWSPHVGELRIVVSEQMRGSGLGRLLVQDILALAVAAGLDKLTARMTPDQRGAIAVFQELGFRGEALLRDHVRDLAGAKHDIVIFSLEVASRQAHLETYGYSEVF
jgi:L-amino acid N-acyltransferase YncA